MGMEELLGMAELIFGVFMNVFIGSIGKIIFKKDDRASRIILRVIGIFLIINGVSRAFHI
ncbi:hypothetical protein P9D79_18475 [Bacillus haynesii]|uniref:hypothetical protein n=1 Tax=Bacillus haynesii TaxID=1925021 RepID=UPI00227F7121|nr:hypothetical protein [Bacillus haynesii]MCY8144120.1 hypothetical protein [Bacillus haynesii]MEC1454333.1 hypothetical protein [Bacillus haynesii]MEC1553618.1 hypothetical protein [Bacillus haynesii]MEC1574925.1 hypothetical protein [Bacillus haynesii]